MKIYHPQLHCHFLSKNDAEISPKDMRSFAEANGIPAIGITEHGYMLSHEPFLAEFKDSTTKLILGVEGYLAVTNINEEDEDEDDEVTGATAHLVLLAKDYQGYQALFRLVTASYDNMIKEKPVMTVALLKKYIGPGSAGHGHVIAMSACMQGVLSVVALHNEFLEKKAIKTEDKAKSIDFNFAEYTAQLDKLAGMTEELEALRAKRQALTALSKKTYKKRIKDVEKLKGTPSYASEFAQLQGEIKESEDAVKKLPAAKAEEDAKSKAVTEEKAKVRKSETKATRYQKFMDDAAALRSQKLDEGEIYDNTVKAAEYYRDIFGDGNFYAELQYHGISEEAICFPTIANIAQELGIPMVATNDCHILTNSEEELRKREILNSLRFNRWTPRKTGDSELYFKSEDEMRAALLEILPSYVVDEAIANTYVIADACNVVIPQEEHYPKFISDGRTAIQTLKDLCNARFKTLTFKDDEERKVYIQRVRYEMEVIEKLNVADYLLIVQDFLAYGRLLGKIDLNDPRFLADPYNIELLTEMGKDNVGFSIGPGRGSAVGSLVCYLIGITDADPIKFNLLFERFLNTERVTMPDIDSDFAPEVRGKVLDYVKHKYGEAAVCCISTIGTQAAKNAIRNCARLLGDRKYGSPKALLNLGSDICAAVPKEVGIKFKDCIDDLRVAFADNEDALEILNDAVIVEGTFTQVGMHAAGVIIADNGDVGEYIPLMKSKDGQWVSQCDMNYTEAKGLLKMDFLGLRNLAIITDTLRAVQKNYGKSIEMNQINLADKKVYSNIFAKGMTNSVFQFESPGMKGMLTRFKPDTLEDLILLVAAYRPGPLQYLDEIIQNKTTGKKPEYVIPEMESVLGVTYGKPIYQEQVMAIFNKFAGFSLGESDIIRRYMSKKKTDKFMAYHDKFIDGMVSNGASTEGAEDFWNQLVDFSKYAFNKSHACAYAIVAYYTGYLKYHFPREYLAAVANHSEFEDIGKVIGDVRAFGARVLNPDINASDMYFDTLDGNIRYGLWNIKNVASAAQDIIEERNANGIFTSFDNFMERTNCRKDVAIALVAAGALDAIAGDMGNDYVTRRIAMLEKLDDKIEEIPTDKYSTLNRELEVLGAYVVENPANGLRSQDTAENLEEKVGSYVEIAGSIQGLQVKVTKTGKSMAMFNIIDAQYNAVPAVCFPDCYSEYRDMLHAGVCTFRGKVDMRDDKIQLVIQKVSAAVPVVRLIVLTPEKHNYLQPYFRPISAYKDENGIPLKFMIDGVPQDFGKPIKVSARILQDKNLAKFLNVDY